MVELIRALNGLSTNGALVLIASIIAAAVCFLAAVIFGTRP